MDINTPTDGTQSNNTNDSPDMTQTLREINGLLSQMQVASDPQQALALSKRLLQALSKLSTGPLI